MGYRLTVRHLKSTHHKANAEAHDTPGHPTSPPRNMDGFFTGPIMPYLPKCAEYDPFEIHAYISCLLKRWNRENAYGILAAFEHDWLADPTLIFGIPPLAMPDFHFPQTPYNLPVLANEDHNVYVNADDTSWDTEPVRGGGILTLDHVSVGVQGAESSTIICSPSSLEVTSRLDRIFKYTTVEDSQAVKKSKAQEIRPRMRQFTCQENSSCSSFICTLPPFDIRPGTFSGTLGGEVAFRGLEHRPNLLARYDEWLAGFSEQPRATFGADPTWESCLDFCIFTCATPRYNTGETFIPVSYSQ
ncbi:hypothetical protein HOY82DRAFT_640452 [Tuber indicum]|nr:hypothetical protein HOY82DRAFT_640452 [Tuber indicum]